jgi:exosome complex RNA-binding protein Rrp4
MSTYVLESLGKSNAFEMVSGMNGRIWINAASVKLVLKLSAFLKELEKEPLSAANKIESL